MARYYRSSYSHLGELGQAAPGSTVVPSAAGEGRYWKVVNISASSGGWTQLSLKEMTDPWIGSDTPTGRSTTIYVAPGVQKPALGAELKPGTSFAAPKTSSVATVSAPNTTSQQNNSSNESSDSKGESFESIASGIASLLNPLATAGVAVYQADQQRKSEKDALKAQQQSLLTAMSSMMMPAQAPTNTGSSNTGLYIVGGLLLAGVVGVGIWAATKK